MNNEIHSNQTSRTTKWTVLAILFALLLAIQAYAVETIYTPSASSEGGVTKISLPVSAEGIMMTKPMAMKNVVFIDIKDAVVGKNREFIQIKDSPVTKCILSNYSVNPSVSRLVLYFNPNISGKTVLPALTSVLEGKNIVITVETDKIGIIKKGKVVKGKEVKETVEVVPMAPLPPPLPPIERPVTVTFSQADLTDVIRALAEKSEMNIYAGPEVQGKITIQVQNQPVGQVLKNILDVNGFYYEKITDNAVKVIAKEKPKVEVPLPPPPPPGPITKVFAVDYASVTDIENAINKLVKVDAIQSLLPPQIISGTGTGDRTKIISGAGTLIITADPDVMKDIEQLIRKLDKPIQQVMIDIRILDVRLDTNKEIGVGLDALLTGSSRKAALGGFFGTTLYGADFFTSATSIGVLVQNSLKGNFMFGLSSDKGTLQGAIKALIETEKADLVANPKLIALNNTESKFDLTEELPYIEFQYDKQNGVLTGTVKFDKKAGITVTIAPQITSDGHILLHVVPNQTLHKGDIAYTSSAGGGITTIPIIDTRKADVNVLMKDGQTLVIGGLRRKDQLVTESRTPWLSDLPLLGNLFKTKVTSSTKSELLILITPNIIPDDVTLTTEEKMMYDRADFF